MPTTKTTPSKNTMAASQKSGAKPMQSPAQKPGAKTASMPVPPKARQSEMAQDHAMLDDTAIIADILTTQKGIVKMYGTALCEGSNEKFRHICNTHLTEVSADQFDSFLYMSSRNLYPTEPAPAPKLTEAKQRYKATHLKMKS